MLCPDVGLTVIVGSHSREGISRFCLHFYSKLVIFTRYKRCVFINKLPIVHAVVGYKPKTVEGIITTVTHSRITSGTVNCHGVIRQLPFLGSSNKNLRRINHILLGVAYLTDIVVSFIHVLTKSGYLTTSGTNADQNMSVIFLSGICIRIGTGGKIIFKILIIMPCLQGNIHRSCFVTLLISNDAGIDVFVTAGILGY